MNDHVDEATREARDLARSTARLFNALLDLPPDGLDRRAAPGEWSPWDIAYHVAQIEVWYFAKLCEAASVERVEALERFLRAWERLRLEGLALARAVPPERLDQPGLLGGVPDWTPRQLLERIAAHDDEHASQVAATLAGQGPDSSGA